MNRKRSPSIRLRVSTVAALMMALPPIGSATDLTSTFLASTTGTTTIDIGDSIQFEVSMTTDVAQPYDTMFWSLSGDADAAVASTPASGWAGVANNVTGWAWNYSLGGMVEFGTDGLVNVIQFVPLSPPGRVSGNYGMFTLPAKIGDGTTALVGTLTITADAYGVWQGGAIQYPGVDGFLSVAVADVVSSITATYTVDICGNGFVALPETCDDSNTTPGDGCDATCQVEPGWSCSNAPSVCVLASDVPSFTGRGMATLLVTFMLAVLWIVRESPPASKS
jgi:cysteine-rich repeat protein